jgi:hypothetical protein
LGLRAEAGPITGTAIDYLSAIRTEALNHSHKRLLARRTLLVLLSLLAQNPGLLLLVLLLLCR